MTLHHRVRERLLAIEALLRETEHWQENAPESRAFASDQPFCLDTMEPLEWLQWVLIPRMHQLLESEMPLPQNFAVAPYYEMALDNAHPVREQVLAELVLLDTLFAGGEV
ncbi:YqcC family protein [Klebsiella huaxiensis]|uniref:YqcC family protein n=1 Tax=Klebsiella TaxID=570 RepID=UPI0015F3F7F9|nr:YqcC family protein [Klebsiella sp. RHBSTW-00215]MBA7929883.1 YqcC family protein [Klebsiella sp. RHBSTW-00215]